MTNLETVRVLEGVALQHGFVGRLVNKLTFTVFQMPMDSEHANETGY